jgi:uncharacterized protein with HEPN domain
MTRWNAVWSASVKLSSSWVLMPDQPWFKFKAFGNVLRHEYDAIEEDKLFDIVRNDLGVWGATEQKTGLSNGC